MNQNLPGQHHQPNNPNPLSFVKKIWRKLAETMTIYLQQTLPVITYLLLAIMGADMPLINAFLPCQPQRSAMELESKSFVPHPVPKPHYQRQVATLAAKDGDGFDGSVLDVMGTFSQPIIWVSLYSVVTTGEGFRRGHLDCWALWKAFPTWSL
jgi:hypothetical protein